MGKKKSQYIKCSSCQTSVWRPWAQKCCGECGLPYTPSTGSGKGSGKDSSSSPETSSSGAPPSGARPKPAPNFKFATAAMIEGLDEPLKRMLRLIEGEKDREALQIAAAPVPGLSQVVAELAELRWPATSPEKECQRELTKAQQDERTAEKTYGDAKGAAVRAREALTAAEKAETEAAAAHEAAKEKTAVLLGRCSALKQGRDADSGDASMTVPAATLNLEQQAGLVRRQIKETEARVLAFAKQKEAKDLREAKGMGKGKGIDRSSSEPYATPPGAMAWTCSSSSTPGPTRARSCSPRSRGWKRHRPRSTPSLRWSRLRRRQNRTSDKPGTGSHQHSMGGSAGGVFSSPLVRIRLILRRIELATWPWLRAPRVR